SQRASQNSYVGHGEIQSLCTCWLHNVCRISREKQFAKLHRLCDEAAHPGHALLEDLPFRQFPAMCCKALVQLLPNPFIRPQSDVLVRLTLEIQTADFRRPHA